MSANDIERITHEGKVVSSDSVTKYVLVKIEEQTECSSCIAAKICKKTSDKHQLLQIETNDAGLYNPGDSVIVCGSERMHRKAILLATIIPCIILIATMLIIYLLTLSEGIAAIVGLSMMFLFFALLYLFRNKIAHEFVFNISHK